MDLARCLRAFIFLFNFLFKSLDLEPRASRSRFDGFGTVAESFHFLIQLLIQSNLDLKAQASRSRLDGSGQARVRVYVQWLS